MRALLPFLLLLIPIAASGQVLESRIGRVEVGSDYVAYRLSTQERVIPRDVMQVVAMSQGPFYELDELQYLITGAQVEGKPVPAWTPVADDSILVLLDSIATLAANVKGELALARSQLENALVELDESRRESADLQQQLSIALAGVDSLAGALFAYQDTVSANRETILQLTSAVATKDVQIAELSSALEEERQNTAAFRRMVDQVAYRIIAILNED